MIPQRLTVVNFMCYRDNVPTLELDGISVACLCGDNGHGKTALLDAITWALWGQARTRTQEELIHQGQKDMSVELEFTARDQRYRVSRRHARSARSRQGSTMLELQVASDNGFRPISGNTTRETEARIRELLHMDYDTFINTAFLRQGDADRLTTSRPSDRKRTLAEVLDLSYYQKLEERARAQSNAVQGHIRAADAEIEMKRQETSQRPRYEEQLAEVNASLPKIDSETSDRRRGVEELREGVDRLHRRRGELKELDERLQRDREEIGHIERQVRSQQEKIGEYQAVIGREAEVQRQFALLQTSRADLDRLDETLNRKIELDGRKAQLEREVALERERSRARMDQLRSRAEDLESRVKRLPEIEESLRLLAHRRSEFEDIVESAEQLRDSLQGVETRARDVKLAKERLVQEMEDTRGKFEMLRQGDSRCPLCQQPLGTEGQGHLQREYRDQGLASKRQYAELEAEAADLGQRRKELASQVASTEADVKNRQRELQTRQTNLERDRDDSTQARGQLAEVAAEMDDEEARTRSEGFAREERVALARVDSDLLELDYDSERHVKLRRQLKELEPYEELNWRLTEAASSLPTEREALETSRRMLERRRSEEQEADERRASLAREMQGLRALESQLAKEQSLLDEAERQGEEARAQKRFVEKQLERCDALADDLRRLERKRAELAGDKGVYDELATAFGKNGIQALIIEHAIPALQADANELLGRLTDNRMSIKLQIEEGRKDSRTGQPSEELHIRIADEVGTRSYETFSGGEAFRINFAIRIALSKLLARRSGAPLPILFIDEGFGSLDSVGQERLTEAIQSIQDDFQKIIVITHVDGIKEAFPVRIEVAKTGAGSTFTIV